jgi:hypothetical protein
MAYWCNRLNRYIAFAVAIIDDVNFLKYDEKIVLMISCIA